MSNYASGYKGADAWFNKVDFFDVFVSSAISGLTAGAGNAVNAGKQVGKAGLFLLKNKNLIKAGEIVLTSAIDITGEGFQPITGKQFGQRVATTAVVWGATEVLGEVLKKAPKVEGAVDNATLKTEQLDPIGEALAIDQSKTVEGIEGAARTGRAGVGSLKNISGSLDDAARLARNQPYGPNTNVFRRLPRSAQSGLGRNLNIRLGDPRYQGWEKWHYSVGPKGGKSVVHYLRNPKTGFLTDFKFK